MIRYILAVTFCLLSPSAFAQNTTCATRPPTDNSNACASTAFVHNYVGPSPGTVTEVDTSGGLTGGPITTTGTISIAPGGAAANVGTLGGDLTGTLPNPTIKSSVALSGSPTTTTQSIDDNSTKIATTAFVQSALAAKSGITPQQFGAKCDGSTDDWLPLQAWLNTIIDNASGTTLENVLLYIPPGFCMTSHRLFVGFGNFQGSVSGSTLTVTQMGDEQPRIKSGDYFAGDNVPNACSISSFGSGTGGTGTYNLSCSATISMQSYVHSRPIYGFGIVGSGYYTSSIVYTGSDTTANILSIGSGILGDAGFYHNMTVTAFRLDSTTKMTAGFALLNYHTAVGIIDPVIDGDSLPHDSNLFGGRWDQEVGVISTPMVDMTANDDVYRISGSPASVPWIYNSEVHLGTGNITRGIKNPSDPAINSTGIHIGGGVGGFSCHNVDILINHIDVLIDTTISGTVNQSIYLNNCYVDSPKNNGYGIIINDSLNPVGSWSGGTKQIILPMWVAGSGDNYCVWIDNWDGGQITVWGTIAGCGEGVHNDDTGIGAIIVSPTANIYEQSTYGLFDTNSNMPWYVTNPRIGDPDGPTTKISNSICTSSTASVLPSC